jgi:hypothetical protein
MLADVFGSLRNYSERNTQSAVGTLLLKYFL